MCANWRAVYRPVARRDWLSSLRPPFSLSLERLVTTLTEEADLAGVDRSLWAVEIPEAAYPKPNLPRSTLLGGLLTYTDCQDEARRLRQGGTQCLEAPSAALLPGGARGWVAMPNIQAAHGSRSGKVWVWFGARPDFVPLWASSNRRDGPVDST